MKSSIFCALASAGLCFLLVPAAQAQQVTITSANPAVRNAQTGQTLTFTVTVQNTSGAVLTIASDNANFLAFPAGGSTEFGPSTSNATVALDDTPFFSSASYPYTLTSGQTTTLSLFSLIVGSAAKAGPYSGYFTLQDGSGQDLSGGTLNFTANVSAAPEPSAWVGLMIGGFGLLGLRACKRRPQDTCGISSPPTF